MDKFFMVVQHPGVQVVALALCLLLVLALRPSARTKHATSVARALGLTYAGRVEPSWRGHYERHACGEILCVGETPSGHDRRFCPRCESLMLRKPAHLARAPQEPRKMLRRRRG